MIAVTKATAKGLKRKLIASLKFTLTVTLRKTTDADYKMLSELAERNGLWFGRHLNSYRLSCGKLKTAQKIELLLINWAGEQGRINGISTRITGEFPSHPKVKRYGELYNS